MNRSVGLAALGLVAAQLLLAAAVFDPSPHTGGDNAGYLTLAFSLIEQGAYLDLQIAGEPIHTKYPPVYPAVLAAAMLLGARTWSAFKALSALFMAGAVLMSFLWVEQRRGWKVALLLASLLTISEAFLFHTRWILSDPLFLFLTWTGIWSFSRGDEGRNVAEGAAGFPDRSAIWLAVGGLAAILAFFTRSAGLPLVVGMALVLAWRGRWRGLALLSVAFLVPALAWWFRAKAGPSYLLEFWLLDPYRPELGNAGLADLATRIAANGQAYVGRWIPGGLMGLRGGFVSVVGTMLFLLGGVGWWRRIRSGPGLAEVFTPLYLGLILLWPLVWAGDRFALPLYALVLYYAADVWLDAVQSMPRFVRAAALTGAILPLLLPAGYLVPISVQEAGACRTQVANEGAFACYPASVREFVKAAEWSAGNLPLRSRVLTRKPRLFYVLTGIQGGTIPLTTDAADYLDQSLSLGMTHMVMDYLDSLASYYMAPVVGSRPGAFCSLVGFGGVADARTEIFGILPPEAWQPGEGSAPDGDSPVVNLRLCPDSPAEGTGSVAPPYSGPVIPLLTALN